jgi:hypothetical protein
MLTIHGVPVLLFNILILIWKKMKNVLILDANQRSALAATRSLGKRGIPVVTGDETKDTLAGNSKYCRQRVVFY